jgi:glycine/serine hydroxymethyltransferase
MIAVVLMDLKNVDTLAKVRQRVRELTARYPLPY